MATSSHIAPAPQFDQKIHDYLRYKATKLKPDEVFDKMRSAMGIVCDNTADQAIYKSGFFVSMEGKAYFVTTTPDLSDDPSNMTVYHASGAYKLQNSTNLISEKVNQLMLKAFECYGKLSTGLTFLDFAPSSIKPCKAGTKIYFGGCPLSSRRLAFHRGTISDHEYNENTHNFTIDGTIVQGFSGGPVVMQNEGKVYLIGVIRSQMVIPSKDLSTHESTAIQDLYRSVVSNRSTGVGNALDANHCYELIDWEAPSSATVETIASLSGVPAGEEFVGRKRGGINARLFKGMLAADCGYSREREGASHEIWSKGDNKVSVPRGNSIAKGTAIGILKTIAESGDIDDETFKTLKSELH